MLARTSIRRGIFECVLLLCSGLALCFAARADQPVDTFQQKALDELTAAEKSLTDTAARLSKELVGKTIGEGNDTFPQSRVDEWTKQPLAAIRTAIHDQTEDRARLARNDPSLTLSDYYKRSYNRILAALSDQWSIAFCEAGRDRTGRVQILTAQVRRVHRELLAEYEKEKQAIAAKYPSYVEGQARLAALKEQFRQRELAEFKVWADQYRAIVTWFLQRRDDLAGRTWHWQDIAFRRSLVEGDVHDSFARQFKDTVYAKYQYLPAPHDGDLDFFLSFPGSPDRLILTSDFVIDDVIRFPDIEYDGPRLFKMGRLIAGSIDHLRRHDDDLPELSVSGTELEKHIRRLHARLSQMKALDARMRATEAELGRQTERAAQVDRLIPLLEAHLAAITRAKAILEKSVAADQQAEALATQVAEAEKSLAAATSSQASANRDRDDAVARLAVVSRPNLGADAPELILRPAQSDLKTLTYDQAVKTIRGKAANFEANPGAPGIKEKLAALQKSLDSLAAQRAKLIAPFDDKVKASDRAVADAESALRELKKKQEQQEKTKDLRPSEEDVRQAISTVKQTADTLRSAADAALLKTIGFEQLTLADAPAAGDPKSVAAYRLKVSQTLASAAAPASAALQRLKSTAASSLNQLEQLLGDHAAAADLFDQLRSHVQLLQKSGATTAELALADLTKQTGGDPATEKAVARLKELADDLDQIANPQRLLETNSPIAVKIRDGAWEQFTQRVKPLGSAVALLKKAKGKLDDAAAIGDWIDSLQRRDPKSLSMGLKLVGDFAGRSSMVAPFVADALKFYADVSGNCIDAAVKLQKRVIDQSLDITFSDKLAAPERVMYTRARLNEILSDRLENPNAAGAVDNLAVVLQVRRLTFLCTAAQDSAIGTQP